MGYLAQVNKSFGENLYNVKRRRLIYMLTDAQRQEQIKVKLKELQELEEHGDPRGDLFEDEVQDANAQVQSQPPQQKLYDADQLIVAMWSETITNILIDCPMSEYKQLRLSSMRNRLLYEMDMVELIPMPPQPQKEEVPDQTPASEEPPHSANESPSRDTSGDKDLDIISQKLKDINGTGGLMAPEEPEPEQSALQKLMGGFGKKKPIERSVAEGHQPTSMG